MEVNYIISKATEDDIVGIYNLLHRAFIKKYYPNSEKSELEKHKKWYEFWLKSPYYLIYVIKDLKGKIIHRFPGGEWRGRPCHPQGRCGPTRDH